MLRTKLSKKTFFIKSIFNRLQRKKAYFKALEADFIKLRSENEMLKRKLYN